ncbi:MAG: hypothetical protein IJ088_13645, partial [Clostridia bacterium]|nr:hypothetical protein [Clostridia bacterium]
TITNSSNQHQAVRLINSGLSKNLDNRWTINEWRVHTDRSQTKSRMQNVTSLSMPDTYDTLLMTVQIPRNWAGDYTLEIRVDKIYVRDKINFQTSRPQSSSRAALPPAKFLFTVPSAFAEYESSAHADLGNLLNLTPGSNGKAVIKNDSGDIINNNIMFSDNVDFDILSLDTEVKDIELNVDTWVDGEVDMATIYLNESALRFLIEKQKNVVLRSYVDDEDSPSFEWILNSTEESYQQYMRDGTGWSLDIPMSVLTNGKNPYELKVVVDTGDDDESLFTNNYDILYMDSSPMVITLEPEDRTVTAGSDTTFTVAVTGGHRPYSYQWQVLMPGGKWEDIPEAWTSRLTLHGVTAQMNGAQYRCIIEDASGRVLTSRHAILSVISSDLPPTGDTQNLSLWLILFALCGASFLIFLLMRRKKH